MSCSLMSNSNTSNRIVQIQLMRNAIEDLRQKNFSLMMEIDAYDHWIYNAVNKIQNFVIEKETCNEIDVTARKPIRSINKIAKIQKLTRTKKTKISFNKYNEAFSKKPEHKTKAEKVSSPICKEEPKAEIIGEPVILQDIHDPFIKPPSVELMEQYNNIMGFVNEEATA